MTVHCLRNPLFNQQDRTSITYRHKNDRFIQTDLTESALTDNSALAFNLKRMCNEIDELYVLNF